MPGTERVRFCVECAQNVYNLSELSTREMNAFIARHEGGKLPCIRLYRRADGTIVTRNCWTRFRVQVRRARLRAAMMLAALTALVAGGLGWQRSTGRTCRLPSAPPSPLHPPVLMGEPAFAPPPAIEVTPPLPPSRPRDVLMGRISRPD